MKSILVPADFSWPSQQAYKFAMDIASVNQGEVFVLKVIDPPIIFETEFDVIPYSFEPALLKEIENEAKKNFDKMRNMFAKVTCPVSFHVNHGPVIPTIRRFIDDNKIDLVVMGTHGVSGLKEFFVGSNTEKIVRFSPVPVFAIRKAPTISSVRNIVFPSTLDLGQMELINKVKALQDFFHARLNIVFVNTPVNFKRGIEVEEAFRKFEKQYQLKNCTLNIRNELYEVDGIMGYAQEIKADMIAMATHGRRGLAHLLAGSVAEDTVNRVDCPVWTFSIRN